ncbi:hypothetical protein, conserved [Babesia bigemina]|uniref:Uncharacterized protein n=1 Tax=Babesia bigemina TaxID=5866 RepID=A0A061DCB7_BABBI|nr:hypothetical protein, conserved [Babesia bigemina]CDR95455.1 hypothetical protein, conserved [Babesia bigemina]|eukprot:XP_012767641.1 hypothetical protein, conserved [Babesia bigemina]
MPVTDTPQTRVRAFVGETPRPRIPLKKPCAASGPQLSSVSRIRSALGEHGSASAATNGGAATASAQGRGYASVPRWPMPSDYADASLSATREAQSATPMHNPASSAAETTYAPAGSAARQRIGRPSRPPGSFGAEAAGVPMYASTSRVHSMPRPIGGGTSVGRDDHSATSTTRDGFPASRLFGDEFASATTSRMFRGSPNSQEVVLFAVHPQTVVRPLRRAVRQVYTRLLEWLLDVLRRRGMQRRVALARLNRTRWFARLFDYTALERMLNIFKLYLSQSDALAVPREFVDVYDAFSHEINRYCLSDSIRPRGENARAHRALVVGGIDFTEETLKSMTRSFEPVHHPSQQTPMMPMHMQSVGLSGSTGAANAGGIASPTDPSGASTSFSPEVSKASINRRYLVTQYNISVLVSIISRLQGIMRQRQKTLDDLNKEREELGSRLCERRRALFERCRSLTERHILSDSTDMEKTLQDIQQQFDCTGTNRTSKVLEDIERHMRVISRRAKSLSWL